MSPDVPTICIGNITVGGTGKTPHTEMILRELLNDDIWGGKNLAILSRGYKRSSKGFQQVPFKGSAQEFGDEPMQMKNKFPHVTVAVDKSRKEGCQFLCNPELLQTSRWDAILAKVVKAGAEYGLPEKFITSVFNAIHEASVEAQNEIISGSSSEE